MHLFLRLIGILATVLLSPLVELVGVSISNRHLLLVFAGVTLLLFGLLLVHVQWIIWVLAYLWWIFICALVTLLMSIYGVLIVVRSCTSKITSSLMGVLATNVIVHSASVDAYYSGSWRWKYNSTWRVLLLLMMTLIYWVSILAHGTILLWKVFCVWFYYLAGPFLVLAKLTHFIICWQILLALPLLSRCCGALHVCALTIVWLRNLSLRWSIRKR